MGDGSNRFMGAVKLYKLGRKTIIEIEDAGSDLEQVLFEILSIYTGQSMETEMLELEQLEQKAEECLPETGHADSRIMTGGPYRGMGVKEALLQYGDQALAKLYGYARLLGESREKEVICEACKRYMKTVLRRKKEQVTDQREMERSIRSLSPLIDGDRLAKMFSYSDLEGFLRYAGYEEKKLAFRGVMDHLIQRGSQ